jgi:hypothetical protein
MPDTAVRRFIADRYQAVHGAMPATDYPFYLMVAGEHGPCATLGYRPAGESRLFLEQYLDDPIEQVLGARLGRVIERQSVVELGDHASISPAATIALWRRAAGELIGQAEFAVAVLTAPLRAMLRRLDMSILELAPASADRLGGSARDWGQYYASDPVLCAGDIAAAKLDFARATTGRRPQP